VSDLVRQKRGPARLAELGDEPGGEEFLAAVLATLGSSDPQVRAHVRALRAIDVPYAEIEEPTLHTAPYTGYPRASNALKVLPEEQEAVA